MRSRNTLSSTLQGRVEKLKGSSEDARKRLDQASPHPSTLDPETLDPETLDLGLGNRPGTRA